jgi:hypothetical protein
VARTEDPILAFRITSQFGLLWRNEMSNSATDLWPSDLVPQELITPHQIMMMQATALNSRMNGLVEAEVKALTITDNEDPRISLRFEISSTTSPHRVMLFEAAHRADFAYPVALIGPTRRLPSYLREKHYAPSVSEIMSSAVSATLSKGRWIEPDGSICATPQEFTLKLRELLASVEIKSAVMAMLKPAQSLESA